MTEPVTPAPVVTPNQANPGATDPNQQPGGGDANSNFDTSKLSDEQLNKMLEDPRLWKTQRLTELREKAKKADEFEKTQKAKEQDDLKKKGEWETIAQQKDQELESYKQKYATSTIDTALMNAAAQAGISDLEAAKLLVDRKDIKINPETGKVEGVEDAIKTLVETRSYLVGKNNSGRTVGSPTNPGNPNSDYDFKLSQLNDTEFYQKNFAAIQKAQRENRILDDRG